jgi:hypothetical protein
MPSDRHIASARLSPAPTPSRSASSASSRPPAPRCSPRPTCTGYSASATNRAFAILSIIAGIVILAAAAIGRNIDVRVNIYGGTGFLVVGTLMLALIPTDANFLGFSMANCIASYLIGTLLMAAGMYGRTARRIRATTGVPTPSQPETSVA